MNQMETSVVRARPDTDTAGSHARTFMPDEETLNLDPRGNVCFSSCVMTGGMDSMDGPQAVTSGLLFPAIRLNAKAGTEMHPLAMGGRVDDIGGSQPGKDVKVKPLKMGRCQ